MATDDWNMDYWRDEWAAQGGYVDDASAPELYGRRVRLRSLESGDDLRLYHLYQWSSHESDEPDVADFTQFRERLRSAQAKGAPFFVVEGLHSGRMIGWVYADQFAADRCSCRMRVYVIPDARVYGAGAEAGIHFLDYLFGVRGMRRVTAEAPLAQERVWKMAQHWGFQTEDVSRDERRVGDQRHEMVRLAIHRDEWRRRLADALGAPDPAPSGGVSRLFVTGHPHNGVEPGSDLQYL